MGRTLLRSCWLGRWVVNVPDVRDRRFLLRSTSGVTSKESRIDSPPLTRPSNCLRTLLKGNAAFASLKKTARRLAVSPFTAVCVYCTLQGKHQSAEPVSMLSGGGFSEHAHVRGTPQPKPGTCGCSRTQSPVSLKGEACDGSPRALADLCSSIVGLLALPGPEVIS